MHDVFYRQSLGRCRSESTSLTLARSTFFTTVWSEASGAGITILPREAELVSDSVLGNYYQ